MPKLKGAENYKAWSLYAKGTLMEKDCYDVVNGLMEKPESAD